MPLFGGSTEIQSSDITGKTLVTGAAGDHVLIADASDSDNLKKVNVSDFLAGGVADGDKGDITVSGSGSIYTIDPRVVTLAKQADIATASFLGRDTAAAGVVEVLPIATAKTMLNLTGVNGGDESAASLTVSGIVELATVAETDTGTDATRAVTPAGLVTIQTDVDANTAKVSNATHTGDVTGATALTIANTAITGKTTVSAATGDFFLVSDASDANSLKKVNASDFLGFEPADADIVKADVTKQLTVGYDTTVEALTTDTFTGGAVLDFAKQSLKTRTAAGDIDIDEPATFGICHILYTIDGTDRTYTTGTGVTATANSPATLTQNKKYLFTIIRAEALKTVVAISEIL